MSETQTPDQPNNVTPIEQAPSIQLARAVDQNSVITQPSGESSVAQPTVEQPQLTPEAAPSAAESTIKLTKRGRFALALTGMVAGVFGLGEAKDAVTEHMQEATEQNIQQVEDYQKTGELKSGKVVLEADKVGVPEKFATEVSSGEDVQELVGVIQDQVDAQGDPGVQPGEVAVVDAEQVDPASPQIIDSNVIPK